jgi:hypothetical protein
VPLLSRRQATGAAASREGGQALTEAGYECVEVCRNESPLLWKGFCLERERMEARGARAWVGLGRIVALHHRASTSCHIH